ncbi:hypothetical protein SAMN05216218_10213 [Halorientalis regularis]|uniref:Uncharacterized protein n=1 Tax=Halorientalis regularis TaxID=660518 RepID=A0A1G7GF56_9EURY|nr:hypothetical protein SAMN05216218_10213 [Halorientalis regularis]
MVSIYGVGGEVPFQSCKDVIYLDYKDKILR